MTTVPNEKSATRTETGTIPITKRVPQEITPVTDTRDILAHAKKQVKDRNLDDYFIVDVDSHHIEGTSWMEILDYMEDPVLRYNGKWLSEQRNVQAFTNYPPGLAGFYDVSGRIPHNTKLGEPVIDDSVHRDITLARRAMESIGVDIQVVFPSSMLNLGLHPDPEMEAKLAYAYNRWLVENVLAVEPRIRSMLYLPLGNPEMCLRIVRELGDKPGVIGFMVTSQRYTSVHNNSLMRLYAEIEERDMPIGFHASINWSGDAWMQSTTSFLALHALSFVHCNMVHLTNWLTAGLVEKFPKLKVIWIESGLAWVPFLMQRLDSEYLMRQSDAPLLKRLPSEYMKDFFYTSQPMERHDMGLLEATFGAINARSQLLYSSDWPHWDWDPPSSIFDLPFLDESDKRNILGENARRLFKLA